MMKYGLLVLSTFALTSAQSFANETKWRIGFGPSFSTATKAEGDLVVNRLSDGAQVGKGSIEYERKDTIAFSLEARTSEENSWGFAGGVQFEPKTRLKTLKINMNGTTSQFNESSEDKVQMTTIYANALYRWSSFYIPFGLNYTALSISPKGEGLSIDGGLGVQLGVGYWFNSNLAAELIVKSSTTEMTIKDVDNDLSMTMEEATITNVHLGVKYFF